MFGSMSMETKPAKRMWARLASGAGLVLLTLWIPSVWNKHGFCQGWANHYAARAKQLRAEAANPALGREESREYLIAADWHDLISRKYAAVASHPWRPCPGYPLITPEEQQIAAGKH